MVFGLNKLVLRKSQIKPKFGNMLKCFSDICQALDGPEIDVVSIAPAGRFPKVEEDCVPIHYLCMEYSAAK